MAKFKFVFEAEDDFQLGDCPNCPLFYEEDCWYDDDGYYEVDTIPHCAVGNMVECPLEMEG